MQQTHATTIKELLQRRRPKPQWTARRVLKYFAFVLLLGIGASLTLLIAWSLIWGDHKYLVGASIAWVGWFGTLLFTKW